MTRNTGRDQCAHTVDPCNRVICDWTIEQDHRGVKGRIRCMRGFKSFASAERFCRTYDELRNFLRPHTHHNQHVPAERRRLLHLRRATTVLAILEAA